MMTFTLPPSFGTSLSRKLRPVHRDALERIEPFLTDVDDLGKVAAILGDMSGEVVVATVEHVKARGFSR